MKATINLLAGLAFLSAALTSCGDETVEPANPRHTVEFDHRALNLSENSGSTTIEVKLSGAASQNSTLSITFNQDAALHFSSNPAAVNGRVILDVPAGAEKVSFTIDPVDNTVMDSERKIVFALSAIPGTYIKGENDTLSVTIADDEVPAEAKSIANFTAGNVTVSESEQEGRVLTVRLSDSGATGVIAFQLQSPTAVYGEDFITEPAFINGKLSIETSPGNKEVTIRIIPINNEIINGESELIFIIAETRGNISKGTALSESVKISDDELSGKPKGYEVFGGQWGLKRTVNYHPDGRVKSVDIEEAFPFKKTRTETYFYDQQGILEKINLYPNVDRVFTWENGRIVKEETINHGVVKDYTNYDYDSEGNIAGSEKYWLNPENKFVLTSILVNLYYQDGNLYKTMLYSPTQDQEEPYLVSTRTYEDYISAENPFPMGDILPTIKSQKNLHRTYILEESGHTFNFNLTYEFNETGQVTRRTARSGNISETAVYYYY